MEVLNVAMAALLDKMIPSTIGFFTFMHGRCNWDTVTGTTPTRSRS